MASGATIVEQTRLLHEDVERLERLLCDELRRFHGDENSTRTANSTLFHEYAVADLLSQVQEKSGRLAALYEDSRGDREEEILHGLEAGSGEKAFGRFYLLVKEIQSFYEENQGLDVIIEGYDEECRVALVKDEARLEETVRGLFTGEEGLGRYLDLEEVWREGWRPLWQRYCSRTRRREGDSSVDVEADGTRRDGDNGPGIGADDDVNNENTTGGRDSLSSSFSEYLASVGRGHEGDLDAQFKVANHVDYVGYLNTLVSYLVSLYSRGHPLVEWERVQRGIKEAFEEAWEKEVRSRWEEALGVSVSESREGLQWEKYDTAVKLERGLGGDKIKVILASMGLKCGGTVTQRAERLFSVRGKKMDDIDPTLFAGERLKRKKNMSTNRKRETANGEGRGFGNKEGDGAEDGSRITKEIAKLEFISSHMCTNLSLLGKQYRATLEKLEKRHAQTYDEFVADIEAEMEEDLAENVFGEEEEENVDNPLKIPLGFDGKPIPYWMYKLHGLNHEFTCEICGNAVYWGRRQFEKHFTEAKHAAGMKALGIPNTRQFFEITSIADAVGLWNTLQAKKSRVTQTEEIEDAEGNVHSI
jgi:splicing factor 3A subunit 3